MVGRQAVRLSVVVLAMLLIQNMAFAQLNPITDVPTTQPGSRPAARTLSMDDAIATALRNSRSLRLAAEAIDKATGRVAENKAGYNPSLSSALTMTHLDEGSSVEFSGTNIPLAKQDQKSITVTATLPLDISGLIGNAIQASQFQEIAARLDFNRTRNQTVLDVKNAYYDILRSKAFVTVAEQSLKNAQERKATAEAYLKAGTGTRFDVLRAETDVANADQNLIAARHNVNLATAALNNVLGLDQNTPLTISETNEQAGPVKDFDGDVAEAYQTRPEILQADAGIKAAEKGVKLAQAATLPSLGVNWTYQYTPDATGFSPKAMTWAAVAQVNLPLFDQGVSKARVRQAQAEVNSAKVNKQTVVDGIALEVRQYYLALEEAQDKLKVASAALTEAEEQYRLAQVRFEAGVTLSPGSSPLLEISDAQTALTQAQSNKVNSFYDLQNARARLDRAIGRYAYDGSSKPGFASPKSGGKK